MWQLQTLRKALEIACTLVEEPGNGEKKKKRVKDLAIQIWEEIDPTPELELDDWLVDMIIDWAIDWVVEDMNRYTKALNLS